MNNLIFLILLIPKIFSLCTSGCLKCNSESNCLICDVNNGYYLSGLSCVQKDVPNCQITNIFGACLMCKSQYFLNSST